MLIIGIGFKKQQGKDTLAAMIQAARPTLPIARLAFADALKEEVTDMVKHKWMQENPDNLFGASMAMESLCRWANVPYDPSPDMTDPLCPYGKQRRLLQWWGTEYRRVQFGENYWVDRLSYKVSNLTSSAIALITDMRFPNEFEMVKSYGGKTLRVTRITGQTELTDNHPSENMLEGFPFDRHIMAANLDQLRVQGLGVFDEWVQDQNLALGSSSGG